MDVTYYVALPFVPSDDGVAPGEAVECTSANAAVMRAEALSRKPGCAGALASSRSGGSRHRRVRRRQADPEVRRRARGPERTVKLNAVTFATSSRIISGPGNGAWPEVAAMTMVR